MSTDVSSLLPRPVQNQPQETRNSVDISKVSKSEAYNAEISYSDGLGNSFNLSLGRTTEIQSLTYDRTGRISAGEQPAPKGSFKEIAKEIREELKDVKKTLKGLKEAVKDNPELKKVFREMKAEIKAFKRELQQMLGMGEKEGLGFHPRMEIDDGSQLIETEHVEAVSASQTLTIEMDVVDTEYWSVENTASRLADFAVALYAGGDRQEHFEQMAASMEKGYEEAKEAFGGWLPDISRETVDRAKEMLKAWADETPEAGVQETQTAQLTQPAGMEQLDLNSNASEPSVVAGVSASEGTSA